jgi:hypothetical protein
MPSPTDQPGQSRISRESDPVDTYLQGLEIEKQLQERARREIELERARVDLDRSKRDLRLGVREYRFRVGSVLLTSVTVIVAVLGLSWNVWKDRNTRADEQRRRDLQQFQANARQLVASQSLTERQLALQSLQRYAKDSNFRRDYVVLLGRHSAVEPDEQLLGLIRQALIAAGPDSAMIEILASVNRQLVDSLSAIGLKVRSFAYLSLSDSALYALGVPFGRLAHISQLRRQLQWNARTIIALLNRMRRLGPVSLDSVVLSSAVAHDGISSQEVFYGDDEPRISLHFIPTEIADIEFVGTTLSGTDLSGVTFRRVRFRGARIDGAHLAGSVFLDVAVDSLTHIRQTQTTLRYIVEVPSGSREDRKSEAAWHLAPWIIIGGTIGIGQLDVVRGVGAVVLLHAELTSATGPRDDRFRLKVIKVTPTSGRDLCGSTASERWVLDALVLDAIPYLPVEFGRAFQQELKLHSCTESEAFAAIRMRRAREERTEFLR